MCLKGLGSIALPEDLSSLLGNIKGEIPTIAITMHTHLNILSVCVHTSTFTHNSLPVSDA